MYGLLMAIVGTAIGMIIGIILIAIGVIALVVHILGWAFSLF